MKSFAKLFSERRKTPQYHSQELAVSFLADLNESMKAGEITNAELARRAGVSPAYITKVFRGPSNLSVDTIAKLAMAVGTRASLRLENRASHLAWQSHTRGDRNRPQWDWANMGEDRDAAPCFVFPYVDQDTSNDEKFAVAA